MRAILSFSLILFFSSILLAPVLSASAAETGDRHDVIVGGWTPIKNLSDPHVQEIARFAVAEHNKKGGRQLILNSVVIGASQVVAGTNYGLVIEATGVGFPFQYYKALVSETLENSRNLTCFKFHWEC